MRKASLVLLVLFISFIRQSALGGEGKILFPGQENLGKIWGQTLSKLTNILDSKSSLYIKDFHYGETKAHGFDMSLDRQADVDWNSGSEGAFTVILQKSGKTMGFERIVTG